MDDRRRSTRRAAVTFGLGAVLGLGIGVAGPAAVGSSLPAGDDGGRLLEAEPTAAPSADVVSAREPTPAPAAARPAPTVAPEVASAGDGEPVTFLETFDGRPSAPEPWSPDGWDVAVHSRDVGTWHELEPVEAAHGPDCAPPPATHRVTSYDDAVFTCADHMMTAISAGGYGAVYLTPDHMVDFSEGEAVVSVDVSTSRTSGRDWWDLWITPYPDNLQAPLESWFPDLAGPPRRAVQISLNESNAFIPRVYRDHEEEVLASSWWTSYDAFLTPDAKRRDTFELRISRTHIAFGMPAYDHWFVDTDVEDLGWDRAVVQLGHHSYNPEKDGFGGTANTWHWDNVRIDPAVPFTIIGADRRYVDPDTSATVEMDAPAPADAHLRFSGMGEGFELSVDGGTTWQEAQRPAQAAANGLLFSSYWTPVPEGTQTVEVRGRPGWLPSWIAKDFAVWSPRR